MANLRIKGDTSGYVDLVSPDVAGSQVINLDRLVETNANGQITVSTDTEHQLNVQSATSGAGGSIKVSSTSAYAYNVVQNNSREWRFGSLGGSNFTITDWSAGPTERLVIKSNGNVGIGTTDPGYKLHVNGDFYSTGNINTANAVIALGTGTGGGLRVHTNSGITASNNYMNFFTGQTNGWSFNTNGNGADSDQKVRISSAGDITASGSVIASGTVLQVQSTTLTGPASYTGNSNPDGTGANLGLNVSITPKSSNSAFYVMCSIGVGSTTSGNTWAILLVRDNVRVNAGMGAAAASHLGGIWFKSVDHAGNSGTDTNHGVGATGVYLDNNSGTAGVATTFRAKGVAEGGSGHINYVESDYTGSGAGPVSSRTQSTITVWEIEK